MNSKHIHTPVSTRARCPVCQQPVYSHAGIHPQCAMKRSEPPKAKGGTPKPIIGDSSEALAVVAEVVAVADLAVAD